MYKYIVLYPIVKEECGALSYRLLEANNKEEALEKFKKDIKIYDCEDGETIMIIPLTQAVYHTIVYKPVLEPADTVL